MPLADGCLLFVSTQTPAQRPRQSWAAVYHFNVTTGAACRGRAVWLKSALFGCVWCVHRSASSQRKSCSRAMLHWALNLR